MKGVSGSHSDGSTSYKVSDKGTELLSVNFTVSRSVELISVWVQTENPLGSANSSIINYTLSKIGKTHISYHQLETNDSRDETCGEKKEKKVRKDFQVDWRVWQRNDAVGRISRQLCSGNCSILQSWSLWLLMITHALFQILPIIIQRNPRKMILLTPMLRF